MKKCDCTRYSIVLYPSCASRHIVGKIIDTFEQRGFKIYFVAVQRDPNPENLTRVFEVRMRNNHSHGEELYDDFLTCMKQNYLYFLELDDSDSKSLVEDVCSTVREKFRVCAPRSVFQQEFFEVIPPFSEELYSAWSSVFL